MNVIMNLVAFALFVSGIWWLLRHGKSIQHTKMRKVSTPVRSCAIRVSISLGFRLGYSPLPVIDRLQVSAVDLGDGTLRNWRLTRWWVIFFAPMLVISMFSLQRPLQLWLLRLFCCSTWQHYRKVSLIVVSSGFGVHTSDTHICWILALLCACCVCGGCRAHESTIAAYASTKSWNRHWF